MRRFLKKALPTILLALAVAVCAVWAILERRRREAYRNQLESMYERSFYELVDGVGNMEVQIGKLLVTDSPGNTLSLLSDIRHTADNAQSSFGMLAASPPQDTAKFINQLGDYCNSLAQRVSQGQPLTDAQREELLSMRDRLTSIGNQMRDLPSNALPLHGASTAEGTAGSTENPLANVGHTGVDYPSLVYDGPFSDASDTPPRGLEGTWIGYEEAERIARAFVGEGRVEWTAPSSEGAGDIPTYGIEMMLSRDGIVTAQITKQGGHVLWMVPERIPQNAEFDINRCYASALAFVSARGYPEVTLSYHQVYENIATFNLIPLQDGILLYPDLIKLQVSMTTGQVVGIEAGNYLRNHAQRALPDVLEPLEDALLLATRLDVEKAQLALIPMLNKEILCHEITGTFLGEPYILYIDAQTGREVDLLRIVDVEGGQLAM